ncbi:DNA-packaging protein [Sphingomonas immobilis]|uniref:Terminase family protein n=1 Tax=Sphingomonas immobilis TaxID=3063997 RepID=A0ABT9A1N1_9SPHN|nr:terminase family protein [Sphingomonas sp. CA1-15]MDO7843734.1 terminase family protein [Sphingomonas sp. CA1-15]
MTAAPGRETVTLTIEQVQRMAGDLSKAQRDHTIDQMKGPSLRTFNGFWYAWAHPGQLAPEHAGRVWLIRAGRGFGKTRAGAEWVSEIARNDPGARIALVGATIEDVSKVMIEGESGILSVARPGEQPRYYRQKRELTFGSGAIAQIYSANTPEKLRGGQFNAAWCDEIGKWRNGVATWDNLMLAVRIGAPQQILVTTTPAPVALVRKVRGVAGMIETLGTSHDNPHLSRDFLAAIEAEYGGTRLGRQEINGELIEDVAGALWTRSGLEACRVARAPLLVRVVIGVDPPAGSEAGTGDACGIVAVGLGEDGHGYVLEDASVSGESPEGWARAVVACAGRHNADKVVAEVNQGGEMVRAVLEAADPMLPLAPRRARLGKAARAEPVSIDYARGRVHHTGAFPALEDEMCGMVSGGTYQGPGRSPDRVDALVWALAELMPRRRGRAGVRGL